MSQPDRQKTAYGPSSSSNSASASVEPNFRKTWDRTVYAARASLRESQEAAEGKARYEAKLAGHKYYHPAAAAASSSTTEARTSRLDVSGQIGKTQIITGAMAGAVGKRGRSAGFYCENCDLTFKDNLQWVEHLNSRGHLVATGESGEVKRAGVQEVRERLTWLAQRRRELQRMEAVGGVDLEERLRGRREEDERERERRREKRREKRRRVKDGEGGGGVADGDGQDGKEEEEDRVEMKGEEEDVGALMGFQGFGSTKV